MNSPKNKSSFQKSTISIVIISAITVGLITLEQSLNKNESYSLQQHSLTHIDNSRILETNRVTDIAFNEMEDMHEIELVDDFELITASIDTSLVETESLQNIQAEEVVDKQPTEKIIKDNVLFDIASSEIRIEYRQSLMETAQLIQNNEPDTQTLWQVVGYADLTGNYQFNIGLAKRRAQAVAAFLVDEGVDEAQLSIVSLGDTNPIEEEQKRGANQLDRRVEIHPYQAEITALAEQITINNKKAEAQLVAISNQKAKQVKKVEKQDSSKTVVANSLGEETELQIKLMENQVPVISNLISRSTMIEL